MTNYVILPEYQMLVEYIKLYKLNDNDMLCYNTKSIMQLGGKYVKTDTWFPRVFLQVVSACLQNLL